jgi:transposase-like protein
MRYSPELKAAVIQKVLSTGRPQTEIANEAGISRSALQHWLREYRKNGIKNVVQKEKRPQDWSAEERFAALIETAQMSDEQLGAWCRKHGLHTHHLKQWKADALAGCVSPPTDKPNAKERRLEKKVRNLEKELSRKEKALAETAALLVLKKKADAIWGDAEDG